MSLPYATLLGEMRLALLAEFGARAIYADLRRQTDDEQLDSVLGRLEDESGEQISELSAVMSALGGRPPERSRRRRALAGVLATSSRVIGRRMVLRVCAQAEDKAARWYAYFRVILVQSGRQDLAERCSLMSATKRRHAQALGAWVSNL